MSRHALSNTHNLLHTVYACVDVSLFSLTNVKLCMEGLKGGPSPVLG